MNFDQPTLQTCKSRLQCRAVWCDLRRCNQYTERQLLFLNGCFLLADSIVICAVQRHSLSMLRYMKPLRSQCMHF